MGQLFGHIFTNGFDLYFNPEMTPSPFEGPTFDPAYGFEKPRCERQMQATEEEMRSVKMPLEDRDFCAHILIKYMLCRKEHFPFVQSNCHHEKHNYLNCKHDDFVIRMKEYEREKRLRKKFGGRGDWKDTAAKEEVDEDSSQHGEVGEGEGDVGRTEDAGDAGEGEGEDKELTKDKDSLSKREKCLQLKKKKEEMASETSDEV